MADYYTTLEVHPRASHEVIKAAYLSLAKQHHENQPLMKRLNAAFEVLNDPKRRAEYDKGAGKVKGKTVGPYRILSQIAEGGFGTTYKGEHILTGAPVCIKHALRVSPQDEELLLEEAKTIWDLRHHGIPAMRDVIRMEDGSMSLVLSYIPGPTLAQIVEEHGDLDPEHVCWIAARCLNILQYLHERHVIHGDVKPQNIIIPPDEKNPKVASHLISLVDYGLSIIKPKADTSNKGFTPYFAAPEQVNGGTILPETDFYGLGMTMIFALGGDIGSKRVPEHTPDSVCRFIKKLIIHDVLSRPTDAETLQDALREVRRNAFGRSESGMKPLKV
jgi:serine/threonine protein kinase